MHASLWSAVAGTLFAVYGIFIAPIGWQYAGLIWLYAVAWAVVNDAVKMWAFRFLRPG